MEPSECFSIASDLRAFAVGMDAVGLGQLLEQSVFVEVASELPLRVRRRRVNEEVTL